MDDSLIAEQARAIELRDKWLIEKGKAQPETKARMKKVADAEENLIEKQAKAQEKAKSKTKNQPLMKLAIANRQAKAEIGTFKDVLSDPIDGDEDSKFSPSNRKVG